MKNSRTTLPKKLRAEMQEDPEYTRCALQGLLIPIIGECSGRVTREHALYFAGKKVQEKFAVPPICEKHHGCSFYLDRGTAIKEIREWVALNRGTPEELASISKVVNYRRRREVLNEKYGIYVAPPIPKGQSIGQ